jgi:hypothetical protein
MSTEIITLPPLGVVRGMEFYQELRLSDADGPIDLRDWPIEAVIGEEPFDPPFWRGAISGREDGFLFIEIPPDQTLEFAADDRLRGSVSAVLQVTLTDPEGAISQVWQGPIIIAGVFE